MLDFLEIFLWKVVLEGFGSLESNGTNRFALKPNCSIISKGYTNVYCWMQPSLWKYL